MEPQVSLDLGACLLTDNIFYNDGASITVTSSAQDHVAPQRPAKKQTRQWAAWTRQEEENFFSALRQVGKNFEKITCRVQSKNKDQVRHYYYRLVRRMNKLLGPELCLDAKNSKDTNAAMLRWWSLLEKYSCKASKLHLKPRRFKLFLDTLEHQLLKDRRKNIRKRHAQEENCSTTSTATVYSQGKAMGNDNHTVKVVLLDRNIQKSGSGKGSSLKRNANIGINRSNGKGESVPLKAVRQRRKPGSNTSAAAYKRWEKAAIAGVSLVADAAEHLERTALDEVTENVQGERGVEPVGKVVACSPISVQNLFSENLLQTSLKLKLQLFPIDEITRRSLEIDNHNPHLELTLSSRKKISSVLEHLNRKWGKSSIACGELVLLPYSVQRENLCSSQRWTQDSVLSAADVYAQIGSPSIFRMRYCWLPAGHELMTCQAPLASPSILDEHLTLMNDTEHQNMDAIPDLTSLSQHVSGKLIDPCRNQVPSVGKSTELAPSSTDVHCDIIEFDTDPGNNILISSDNPVVVSSKRETCNLAILRQVNKKDKIKSQTDAVLTPAEWADSLTNISIGDLLSEPPDNIDSNCISPSLPASSHCQAPFSGDSFDAAIAALIYKHQDKSTFQPTLESHVSSIWDAEETCDAFSFKKNSVLHEKVPAASTSDPLEAGGWSAQKSAGTSGFVVKDFAVIKETVDDDLTSADPIDEFHPDSDIAEDSAKDFTGLSDLYWSESLAPLDLDRPSCKYHNEDLILSDSMSGLNRLIASSLDAFQNCSFFSLDKKEPVATVEAREGASFPDYKGGGEVEMSKV